MLLLAACAKQGMPSGGPKDETPPQVLRMRPDNRTLQRDKGEFAIDFDEYVVIKDAENNILVSPPMTQKPEYKTRGKSLVVRVQDTLQPNTTYVFQMKDAIADYNEGNLLPSLEYVFSTGAYIDSMTVRGRVVEALTHEANTEAMSVWLYTPDDYEQMLRSLADTAIRCPQPCYTTRCDKDGTFSLNYLRGGTYRCLAIADEDKNLVVSPTEAIAFLDSAVVALGMKDSVVLDSTHRYCQADSQRVALHYYTPRTAQQRIASSGFKGRGRVELASLLPMTAPHVDAGSEAVIWRLNAKRDTMTLWTLHERCDSLRLIVTDTSGLHDTLRLRYTHGRSLPQKGGGTPSAGIKLNYNKLPYYDTLRFTFTTPLDTARYPSDSVVRIMNLRDSSLAYCPVRIDSSLLRADIVYPFRAGAKYEIDIPRNRLYNIWNRGTDTLHAVVTVTEPEEYGTLNLAVVADVQQSLVVQLLDEKGATLRERRLDGSGTLQFPHLLPAKYRLRAIVDANANGQWDGGDLKQQQQPERVVYMRKVLDIRANWEYNEQLTIATSD